MVDISNELARAVQGGDCVLWVGAGLGVTSESAQAPDFAKTLAAFPWRACISTVDPDLAKVVFEEGEVVDAARDLSLEDTKRFVIVDASKAVNKLVDFVEEVAQTRTVLFVGFDPDDAELARALDLLERGGGEHFVVVAGDARALEGRAVKVLSAGEDDDMAAIVKALGEATADLEVQPADESRADVFELVRSVRAALRDPANLASIDALKTAIAGLVSLPEAAIPQPITDEEGSRALSLAAPEDPDDLEAWAAILERKGAHLEARQAVDRIEDEARDTKRWDRLVEVLGVKAEHAQRQQDRVKYLREMVSLFEKELGAPRSAFETLQALIESVEVAEQVKLADEVMRLAAETGDWAPAAETLGVLAERAPSNEDAAVRNAR